MISNETVFVFANDVTLVMKLSANHLNMKITRTIKLSDLKQY